MEDPVLRATRGRLPRARGVYLIYGTLFGVRGLLAASADRVIVPGLCAGNLTVPAEKLGVPEDRIILVLVRRRSGVIEVEAMHSVPEDCAG